MLGQEVGGINSQPLPLPISPLNLPGWGLRVQASVCMCFVVVVFVNEMLFGCVSIAGFWLPLPPFPCRPFLVISGSLPDHLPLLGDSVSFASGLIHKCGMELGGREPSGLSDRVQRQ